MGGSMSPWVHQFMLSESVSPWIFALWVSLGQTWGLRVKIPKLVFYVFLAPLGSQPFISRRILITFIANPSVRHRFWTPIFGLNPNYRGKWPKTTFLFCEEIQHKSQKQAIASILGVLKPGWVEFSKKKNFARKNFFGPPLTEKIGKKSSKMAKNGIFGALNDI